MNDTPTLPITRFDLQDLPEQDRFAVWKDSISVIFDVSLESAHDERNFSSQLTTCHFGSFLFSNSISQSQLFRRSRKLAAQDGLDYILVQIYRRGRNIGVCGKTSLNARPGDVFLLDLGQTLDTRTDDYDNLTLVIPRSLLAQHLKFPERLHGQVLPRESLSGQLLRMHIETLWSQIDRIAPHETQAIADGLIGLVAAYFGGTVPDDMPPEMQENIRAAILQYIEQNLENPGLTPHSLAARFQLSRASLYRLFEPVGSPASYIREQRLHRCLSLLTQPAHRHRSVADIAASMAFADEAHFCRLFRRTFGITPGEARHCALLEKIAGLTATYGKVDRCYENWVRTLECASISTPHA